MRLFPRLLLNHLVVVTVTAAVLLVAAALGLERVCRVPTRR